MASANGTKKFRPELPYEGFPLYPHLRGYWAKKIDGKTRYFGRWSKDDPGWEKAIKKYEETVLNGETVAAPPTPAPTPTPPKRDGMLATLLMTYLDSRKPMVANRKMSPKTYEDYKSASKRLIEFFGRDRNPISIRSDEWQAFLEHRMGKRNIVTMGNEIQRIRTIFKWLAKSKLIRKELTFCPDFKKPSVRETRKHRRLAGDKFYHNPSDVLDIMDELGVQLRAMAMLGLNCAFGPTDCGNLTLDQYKQACEDDNILCVPRSKTETDRTAWLWPETIEAIELYLPRRRPNGDTLFVHRTGNWLSTSCYISKGYTQGVRSANLHGTFYWLRHTFATIAGDLGDQVAVDMVMGHVDPSTSAVYRHEVKAERTRKVCEYVRRWLYQLDAKAKRKPRAK